MSKDHPNQNVAGDHTRTEQALRASELSYRRLFEAAKDGILILDVDNGRITDVNPFLVHLLGFSRAEMLGKTVGELSPFKDIEENRVMLERLQNNGYVRYEDLPLETRDGRHIAVEFVSNVYQASAKNVIQCNIRDITQRKDVIESLRKSEERFRVLFNLGPVAVYSCDVAGTILEFNRRSTVLWGRTPAAGDTDEKFCGSYKMHRPDGTFVPHDECAMALVLTGKIPAAHNVEVLMLRPDNSWITVIANIVPLKNDQGEITGAINCFYDITERKLAEDTVRRSEARLRAFVSASSDVMYRMNPDWSEMQELQGRDFITDMQTPSNNWLQEYIYPDDQPLVLAKIQEVIRTKRNFELEHRIRRAGGTVGWTFSRAVAILDAQGQIVEWFGAASDVTERKQAENEIRRLNAELEQRVTERTGQLQTANEELEAFSYSVSHDLRAPLRHVMGFVELLQKDAGSSLSEKSLKYLTTISDSAKRMGTLIDDLLAFSRVGRAEMQKADIKLDELIRETLGDFQAETEARKIQWKTGPLPVVRADRALLRLALTNLVSNAVKFTSHRAEARIEIGCVPGGDRESVIFIRDNGAGFDPDYVHKLFGVFQRLHSDAEFEGTGIGLANVQRIIHRHGGRVWAEGVVDGGATFYFSIPKQPDGATNGH